MRVNSRVCYSTETDNATDMTKAKFVCITHVRADNREHTLWGAILPGGRETFVAAIGHKQGKPHYTRGFATRTEAFEYFGRFMPAQGNV